MCCVRGVYANFELFLSWMGTHGLVPCSRLLLRCRVPRLSFQLHRDSLKDKDLYNGLLIP